MVRHYWSFEHACDAYALKLEKERKLGRRYDDRRRGMPECRNCAKSGQEAEFSQCVAEHSPETDHTVCDLYVSLCVLSNQAWVPVWVLGRMWQLEADAAMDIATLLLRL